MTKGAKFSECGLYRYLLWRKWDESKPIAMCIGLNPSKADSSDDDPTIESLIRILRHNGYGGFYMANLFAFISPNPDDLRSCSNPIKDNDTYLIETAKVVSAVIFCWGNFKQAEYRAKNISRWFVDPYCLGKNKNGSPVHPLYKKSTTEIIPFT